MRRHPSSSGFRLLASAVMFFLSSAAGASAAHTGPQTLATEWKQWNGHHYRLESDGHLSCYAEDSDRPNTCSLNTPTAKGWPLKCNDPRWGGDNRKRTGYQVIDHWCNKAYANLFATWLSYRPLRHNVELATGPRGDVMCRSADGTTCMPAGAPTPASGLNPLVCGRMLRDRTGSKGYDDPKHWCSSREIVPVFAGMKEKSDLGRGIHGFPAEQKAYIIPLPAWSAGDEPRWVVRMERRFNRDEQFLTSAVTVGVSHRTDIADYYFRPYSFWSAVRQEPRRRTHDRDILVVKASTRPDGSIAFEQHSAPLGQDLTWTSKVHDATHPFQRMADEHLPVLQGATSMPLPWELSRELTPHHLLIASSGLAAQHDRFDMLSLYVVDVTFTRKRKVPAF